MKKKTIGAGIFIIVLLALAALGAKKLEPEPEPEPEAQFYMPPKFTRAEITSRWEMPPYYYVMNFECPITNKGDAVETQTIVVGNNHPDELTPWSFSLTLNPGETYLWKHFQNAIWPMTFYLQGDWEVNNYSEGVSI